MWAIASDKGLIRSFFFQFQILSFVHFTDIGSRISLSRQMTRLSASLIRLVCRYEIARFSDAAIALALIARDLEHYTSGPAKWTWVTGKLQQLVEVCCTFSFNFRPFASWLLFCAQYLFSLLCYLYFIVFNMFCPPPNLCCLILKYFGPTIGIVWFLITALP